MVKIGNLHPGKQIPLGGRTKSGQRSRYPFTSLEVGDWFVVPVEHQTSTVTSFRTLVGLRSKELGVCFTCHLLFNGDVEVVRKY